MDGAVARRRDDDAGDTGGHELPDDAAVGAGCARHDLDSRPRRDLRRPGFDADDLFDRPSPKNPQPVVLETRQRPGIARGEGVETAGMDLANVAGRMNRSRERDDDAGFSLGRDDDRSGEIARAVGFAR